LKSLFALVGMKHRGTEALVASLPQGEPLELIREPTNQFDPNAIKVFARGQHVGYIAAKQAKPLAVKIDRQDNASVKILPARLAIDGGRWPMCEVEE
jgi:hypothetical protein